MFWRSSPKELAWESDAARTRIQERRKDRRESAWLVAALMRQKRLPKLAALTGEDQGERKPQTWQEMKAIMKGITAGG